MALIVALLIAAVARSGTRQTIVQQLNAGLAGTPLAGYGQTMDAAGRQWNVSPFLIAAISGVESSFGAAACGGNAWGISSCKTSFPSFTAGIAYVAKLLRTGYLDPGLNDPWSIGRVYCGRYGTCTTWGSKVEWFMRAQFHASTAVTYPGR